MRFPWTRPPPPPPPPPGRLQDLVNVLAAFFLKASHWQASETQVIVISLLAVVAVLCLVLAKKPKPLDSRHLHDQAPAPATSEQAPIAELSTTMRTLSELDDRLVERLQRGDIRLLRCSWLCSQPADLRLPTRQDLEQLEREGTTPSPLLSHDEAVKLIRQCDRSTGILSHGWLSPGHCDPCSARVSVVQQALRDHRRIAGLFWDQASARSHTLLRCPIHLHVHAVR